MKYIKVIEISYLRSTYKAELKHISDFNIFSGENDVGKSNILKALNLFFNGQVDWQTPFDFDKDLSIKRHEQGKEASKEYIWIKITFINDSYKTLPKTFQFRRLWNRHHEMSEKLYSDPWFKENEVEMGEAEKRAKRFIRSIDFRYVPAVKDRNYFDHLLQDLRETLVSDEEHPKLRDATKALNEEISVQTQELHDLFYQLTGISTEIEIPTNVLSLIHAAGIVQAGNVPLTMRGDGIQVSYIPSILYFMSQQTKSVDIDKNRFIWGFEEPENSLEYGKVIDLTEQFLRFSDDIQIFMTSHSPAFISLRGENLSVHRVYFNNKENQVKVDPVYCEGKNFSEGILEEELGILHISERMNDLYQELKQEYIQLKKQKTQLEQKIKDLKSHVVYVEGKNDVLILEAAWEKCYPDKEMPFVVKSCDPLLGEGGGNGGVATLRKTLEVVPKDVEYAVIGVFDYDKEGYKHFKKLANFEDGIENHGTKDYPACVKKASHNRKVAAFTLPVPEKPDRFASGKAQNLFMELYFSDEVLSQLGVEFIYEVTIQDEGPKKYSRKELEKLEISDNPEKHRTFCNDQQKTSFAQSINDKVAKYDLPSKEFQAFFCLFELAQELINDMKNC